MMQEKFIEYIKDRFGFTKDDFKGLVFIADRKRVYVTTEDVAELGEPFKKPHSYGIVAGKFQRKGRIIKPTTNFLQLFGNSAKKNIIDINEEEKEGFIRGLHIETHSECDDGYVIVRWNKHILGCGMLRNGIIYNQIPYVRLIKI